MKRFYIFGCDLTVVSKLFMPRSYLMDIGHWANFCKFVSIQGFMVFSCDTQLTDKDKTNQAWPSK